MTTSVELIEKERDLFKYKPSKSLPHPSIMKRLPKEVDILSAKDICQESLFDGGKACLTGYAALNFMDDIHPAHLTGDTEWELPSGQIIDKEAFFELMDIYDIHLETNDIQGIFNYDKKIGIKVMKALEKAISEINGEEEIHEFNDYFSFPGLYSQYHYKYQKQHLRNVARVWNRAMYILGYNSSESSPLKKDKLYEDFTEK